MVMTGGWFMTLFNHMSSGGLRVIFDSAITETNFQKLWISLRLRGHIAVSTTRFELRHVLSLYEWTHCKFTIYFWLVVLAILKNINQWEGLSHIFEGSLEVKLPTIWTDEKQSREEAERRERLEEIRVEEKE